MALGRTPVLDRRVAHRRRGPGGPWSQVRSRWVGRCASPVLGIAAPTRRSQGKRPNRTLASGTPTDPCPCGKTEPAMRDANRGFFVLGVLLWLIAGVPGTPVPGAGGVTPALAGGGPCGKQSDDADEVAAVRAAAAEQCDCEGARNHDKYVHCVERVANAAVKDKSLRNECKDDVVQCADMSTCGRPGFVTCCRTDEHGHTMCNIKHREDDCKPPHGGTACVGSQSSCCDACAADGTCISGGTTTTTAPPATTTSTTAATTTTTTTAPTTTTTKATTRSTTAATTTS